MYIYIYIYLEDIHRGREKFTKIHTLPQQTTFTFVFSLLDFSRININNFIVPQKKHSFEEKYKLRLLRS